MLLGTGAGIAFFTLVSHRTRAPALVAHVAGRVVIADWLFTATAAMMQPLTGLALAHFVGWPPTEGWLLAPTGRYVVVGILAAGGGDPAADARPGTRRSGERPVPASYGQLVRIWFACGWPAFAAMLAVPWLTTAKPLPPV